MVINLGMNWENFYKENIFIPKIPPGIANMYVTIYIKRFQLPDNRPLKLSVADARACALSL